MQSKNKFEDAFITTAIDRIEQDVIQDMLSEAISKVEPLDDQNFKNHEIASGNSLNMFAG